MEKDMIFLSDKGITDTVANRIADFAKLSYAELESELSSISFVDSSIETINGTVSKELSFGITSVDGIEEKISTIGNLKALCAWLREAVKAHQRVIEEARNYSIDDYAKDQGIELPIEPNSCRTLSEDDVVSMFDIKKRNRYYFLEANAATVGEFIHKGSAVDRARKDMYDKISKPRTTSGSGNDMLIYSYKPSIDKASVETLFYKLQQKHAEYQSELNSLKSEIKSRITNDEIDKAKDYEAAYKEYSDKYQKIYNDYSVFSKENIKKVQSMKIVIPNALNEIYNKVSNLGKIN